MTTNKNTYVYIDESGSLFDKQPFFVVALVCQTHPRETWGIMKKARQKILRSKKPFAPKEIKFNNSSESLRKFVLRKLATKDVKIYTWVIDKEGRRIAETPQNFAAVLNFALHRLPGASFAIITIDRKFTKRHQLKIFSSYFHFGKQSRFAESYQKENLQLADFVAGAFGAKYNLGNKSFTDLIKNVVVKETVAKWTQIKKEALEPTGVRRPRLAGHRLGHHSGGPTSPWTYSSADSL